MDSMKSRPTQADIARPGSAKTAKWSKIPTAEEITSFSGVHCAGKYHKAVATKWRCPSCRRSAQELIRWSKINGVTMRARYADEHGMGWTTSIVGHHCHRGLRFPTVMLCGDCNSADGTAKRKLGLPASWSFSPEEIGAFVTVKPHSGETIIDYDIAWQLFESNGGNGLG